MRLLHILFATALAYSGAVYAQGRALPILDINPDTRSASMGGVALGHIDANYLYTNPAAFLSVPSRLSVDAGAVVFPKYEDAGRRVMTHASFGLRLGERHALFGGLRYLGGLRINYISFEGNQERRTLKPATYVEDLGYAFKLNEHYSFYGVGTFAQDRITKMSYGFALTLGASYKTQLRQDAANPYHLNLGVKLAHVGPAIAYSRKSSLSLPSSMSFGGDICRDIASGHKLTATLDARYFFLPSNASFVRIGTGMEYSWRRMLALRAGYEYTQRGASHLTTGCGFAYKGWRADVGYLIATSKQGEHILMCSIGYRL